MSKKTVRKFNTDRKFFTEKTRKNFHEEKKLCNVGY